MLGMFITIELVIISRDFQWTELAGYVFHILYIECYIHNKDQYLMSVILVLTIGLQ